MSNPFKSETIQKLRTLFNKRREILLPASIDMKETISEKHVEIGGTKTAYLRSMTLKSKFKQLEKKKYKVIFFCIYRIRTEPENEPFLEYLLYKYPPKNKDICIFPFIKPKGKVNINDEMNKMMHDKLKQSKLKWTLKGFISEADSLYLFIKMTREKQYLFSQRVLKRNTEWWWCIIDEICNQKHILNFPIHNIVTKLFLSNPLLIYLKDTQGFNKPIPRSLYYGQNAQYIPFNFIFGPKTISGPYGPYYYMSSYYKAIRWGGLDS